jgi:hypothetical protein
MENRWIQGFVTAERKRVICLGLGYRKGCELAQKEKQLRR